MRLGCRISNHKIRAVASCGNKRGRAPQQVADSWLEPLRRVSRSFQVCPMFKDFRHAATVVRGGASGGCGALERRRIIIYRFSEISNALIETRGILVVPAAP